MSHRIYLSGAGPRHLRPLVGWIKNNMKPRFDKNGVPFIFLSDLLPYKGQYVGTNRHNLIRIGLENLLNDHLVAFGVVKTIVEEVKKNHDAMESLKKMATKTT